MRMLLSPTNKIVELNGAPARIWEGLAEHKSGDGIPVMVIISRISPQTLDPAELRKFDEALEAAEAPRSVGGQALDLRLII